MKWKIDVRTRQHQIPQNLKQILKKKTKPIIFILKNNLENINVCLMDKSEWPVYFKIFP